MMHPTSPSSSLDPIRNERGMALIVALMSMLLLSALGLGLMMTTMTETMIANNYRESGESLYAADAAVERVMQDLLTIPDWNRILMAPPSGQQSSFVDGTIGTRTLEDGSVIDLAAATNMMNCAKLTACLAGDLTAWTAERPYGLNNPVWRLVAHAPLSEIIETGTIVSPMYVAVWIADDIGETDNNPLIEGGPPVGTAENLGRGILMIRAESFGPGGAKSILEVTVAKTDTTELERGYTGQRGQDEQNRRARKAAVQTPGKGLTRSDVDMGSTTGGFVVR
jgi:hypothetical protein